MNNDKLSIAERIRAATIADSNQEGVNIAEGRFGSAMASLCRELDIQHQGKPSATAIGEVCGGDSRYNTVTVHVIGSIPGKLWTMSEPVTLIHGHPAEQPAPVSADSAEENMRFEKWEKTQSDINDLRTDEIGLYYNQKTGIAHDAWQARAHIAAVTRLDTK